MKKIFELDINDDFRKAIISQFALMVGVFCMSIFTAVEEQNAFQITYLFELLILSVGFNFYFESQKNRNYAYWTISIILLIYILFDILKYTFVEYNIFILYIAFLSLIFLIINCYIMSSPLFFPRVQWWEYDFHYRGDIKSLLKLNQDSLNSRITDIRRQSACIEAFEFIPLDSIVTLELQFDDKYFSLPIKIKTSKVVIPGRPFRYGAKFIFNEDNSKKSYIELLKIWNSNKTAKIRNKFLESTKNESK